MSAASAATTNGAAVAAAENTVRSPMPAADRRRSTPSRKSSLVQNTVVTTAANGGRRSTDPEGNWTAESMAYLKSCAANAIKPNGEIHRVLSAPSARSIVILQLQNNYVGDGGLRCLSSILVDSLPSLRGLGLAGNGIANDGVAALCKAVSPPNDSHLSVIDLQENPKITRAGGQALLNAAGKCRHLVYLYLENTRVTDYFAKRVATHTQLNFSRYTEAQRREVEEIIDALNGVEDEEDEELHDHDASNESGSVENRATNHGVAEVSTQAQHASSSDGLEEDQEDDDDENDNDAHFDQGVAASNEPFDEAFYVADDEDIMLADDTAYTASSSRAVSRPNAPSGLETVLFSTTPDFISVFQPSENSGIAGGGDGTVTSGKFSITNMPARGHTVYGHSTPTPYEYDIFALVDQYKPLEIELPTKFIFPGKIDYMAAVHAPDAFIGPPMPSLLPTADAIKRRAEAAARAAEVGDTEMDEQDKTPAKSSKYANDNDDEDDDAPAVAIEEEEQTSTNALAVTPPAPPVVASGQQQSNNNTTTTVEPPAVPPLGSVSASNDTPSAAAATTGAPNNNSMYWNFFHTAGKTPDASGCTTPRENQLASQQGISRVPTNITIGSHSTTPVESSLPSSKPLSPNIPVTANIPPPPSSSNGEGSQEPFSPEDYVDNTVELLLKVPRYVSAAPSHLTGRLLQYSCGEPESAKKSLCELMLDPSWTPSQPTRGAQVSEYCKSKRLKYNYVMMERMKIAENAPREFYLQRIIRPSLTDKLTAGTMDITGRLLATSSYDMTCKIWDLETGKKLHTLRGHQGHLSDCIWNSPKSDKIITASFDKTVRVWEVATGTLIHTMRGHELEVVCMCMSPDGTECVSGGMDDLAIIWDIEKGEEKHSLTGHNAEVVTVDYSPVGNLVVTGSMDEQLRVWNAENGNCLHVLEGHTQEVSQAKFNKFGNMILSGSSDGTCRLWDVATGNSKVLRGHTHEVVDVDFSPDGWTCASASDDGTARIWDVLTGGCLSMLVGHQKGVCRVAFTKDGKELLTGSLDSTAKVWNIDTAECKQTLRGHRNVVLVFYNAASERILTLSKDNTCRVWRLEPNSNTLFHKMALALCQHPTMYTDVAASNHLPPAIDSVIQRIYKKLHRTDREALTAPTPLPQMRSPDPDEDSSIHGTPNANATPVSMW